MIVRVLFILWLWVYGLFCLMLHITLPILMLPLDHVFVFSERYRGISYTACIYTAAWPVFYFIYWLYKRRRQYRFTRKESNRDIQV